MAPDEGIGWGRVKTKAAGCDVRIESGARLYEMSAPT
ncbi:hypothetical protein COLO4_31979 [Corchorus olitorius]|uniref:Uncharacterized protein n=1 Tax=Corchorus olitorius TaxID=93759 RepID=A0A1R3H2R3_9ROSI|nr:hypothetical protein COLO4_31979 [Corchorus olitorius]